MARILTTGPAILNKIVNSTASHLSGNGGSHGGGGSSRGASEWQDNASSLGGSNNAALNAARISALYQSADDFSTPTSNGSVSNPSGGGNSGGGNSSGGGSSYVGGSSVSVSGGGSPTLDNVYNSMMDDYRAMMEAQAAQRQAEYENAKSQLTGAYERGKQNLNQSADDAYRQAYITYMNKRKGLNQQLANAGINGGAAESSIASLFNNYGSDRAGIARQQMASLGDLEADYNANLGNLSANYGNDYTNILSDYYGNLANMRASYAQDLANLLQKSRNAQSSSVASGSTEGGEASPELASVSNLGRNLNDDEEVTTSNALNATGSNLLASTPGASAMLRNFQNKMMQGDEKGAYDLINNLLAQGYSRAFINALIEASGY